MNILFLSHRVPFPPNKGEKIRTFHQIRYLAERGHTVSVATPLEQEADQDYLKTLLERWCRDGISNPKPGRTAFASALIQGKALSVSNFYSRQLQRAIDEYAATHALDTIVCTSSSMAEYVFRSQTIGRPDCQPRLIMDFMDLDSDKWRQYESLARFPMSLIYRREKRLIAAYEEAIYRCFDACLFISQSEVDLFRSRLPDARKLHVVANGMDVEAFRPTSARAEPYSLPAAPVFLFTGVMDYLPNEDAVCWFAKGAWRQIRSRYPDAVFYIAGMNPSKKVQELASLPGIVVTGFVDDITQYYDKATMFIAPFRLARGVQNKVLQALSCGLPVITTSLGAEGIEATDGEHLLIANCLEDMLTATDRLMTEPDLTYRLGNNARNLIVEQFSWHGKLASFETLMSGQQA